MRVVAKSNSLKIKTISVYFSVILKSQATVSGKKYRVSEEILPRPNPVRVCGPLGFLFEGGVYYESCLRVGGVY